MRVCIATAPSVAHAIFIRGGRVSVCMCRWACSHYDFAVLLWNTHADQWTSKLSVGEQKRRKKKRNLHDDEKQFSKVNMPSLSLAGLLICHLGKYTAAKVKLPDPSRSAESLSTTVMNIAAEARGGASFTSSLICAAERRGSWKCVKWAWGGLKSDFVWHTIDTVLAQHRIKLNKVISDFVSSVVFFKI